MICHAAIVALALELVVRAPPRPKRSIRSRPKEVLDVLHAPLPADSSVSPTHDTMILAAQVSLSADILHRPARAGSGRKAHRAPQPHRARRVRQWTDYRDGLTMVSLPDGALKTVSCPRMRRSACRFGAPTASATRSLISRRTQSSSLARLLRLDADAQDRGCAPEPDAR